MSSTSYKVMLSHVDGNRLNKLSGFRCNFLQSTSSFQSIMGILISALTGSEDPQEVAIMAKQATEVCPNKIVHYTDLLSYYYIYSV